MAISKAEMMTLALRYLGITNATVTDPNDPDDPFAVTFSVWWKYYIPKELEIYDWRFARTSEALVASGSFDESPYGNLPYVFGWPSACLTPRFIPGASAEETMPYEVGVQGNPGKRERLLYTSKEDASLIYTCDLSDDYALFHYSFGVAIAGRLALEYATKKSGAGKQLEGLKQLYAALLGEARTADAQLSNEVTLYDKFTPRFLAVRGGSTSPRPTLFRPSS